MFIEFFIVFSSSPINNKFYRPSSVALLYSISGLLRDMYVLEMFISSSFGSELSQECG